MTKTITPLTFTSMLLFTGFTEANTIKPDTLPKDILGSYIVVLNKDVANIRQPLPERLSHGKRLSKDGNILRVDLNKQQLADIKSLEQVVHVEPNQWVSFDQYQDTNADDSGNIWGLDRVDQRQLPLNEGYNYEYDGSGVDIYVIDTGVNLEHQEFGSRGRHGWDFVDNDNDATDCNGHGTHVAGTAAGNTFGVAKGANVVAIRVGTCDQKGQLDWVINAINWVSADHQAKKQAQPNSYNPSVINMSITAGASEALDWVVRNAIDSGITFVTSAGNARDDACKFSPGRVDEVVNVAASTQWDTRWGFSNYKSCVDLFAPGSAVKSAWHDSNTATYIASGTSMAAPHVAGAAALYLEESRALSVENVHWLLTERATKNKLRINSGTPNRLLFTLADDSSIPVPKPVVNLSNGVGVDVEDEANGQSFYKLAVEQGALDLNFATSGGSGEVDMWVKFGSKPTTSDFDCYSGGSGTTEQCELTAQQGDYYVLLQGNSGYSNVQLLGAYRLPDDDGVIRLGNDQALDITDFRRFEERLYKVEVPQGKSQLTVKTYGDRGDYDLYVSPGAVPSDNRWACKRTSSSVNETCTFDAPQAGYYYIKVRAYNVYYVTEVFLKAEF